MYKNSTTHYIAKLMVDILFYGGILCTLAVPFIPDTVKRADFISVSAPKAILFLSGTCAVYILFNLKQMFKTLLGGSPFVEKNVSSFRKMAVACALVALLYLINCFIAFTFSGVTIVLIFTIGCLFCLTLKDVFKQAIAFKEENDLTI